MLHEIAVVVCVFANRRGGSQQRGDRAVPPSTAPSPRCQWLRARRRLGRPAASDVAGGRFFFRACSCSVRGVLHLRLVAGARRLVGWSVVVWSGLCSGGVVRARLRTLHFRLLYTSHGRERTRAHASELGWTRMDQDGPGWTRMDQNGPEWTRMDVSEPDSAKSKICVLFMNTRKIVVFVAQFADFFLCAAL